MAAKSAKRFRTFVRFRTSSRLARALAYSLPLSFLLDLYSFRHEVLVIIHAQHLTSKS